MTRKNFWLGSIVFSFIFSALTSFLFLIVLLVEQQLFTESLNSYWQLEMTSWGSYLKLFFFQIAIFLTVMLLPRLLTTLYYKYKSIYSTLLKNLLWIAMLVVFLLIVVWGSLSAGGIVQFWDRVSRFYTYLDFAINSIFLLLALVAVGLGVDYLLIKKAEY